MKPKISIIIITLGRETLYPLIDNLLKQKINLPFEIVLVPQNPLKEQLLKNKKIKIFYEPLGKGFAYYRNVGIKHSKGEILTFIDDDEMPMNNKWLEIITKPIRERKEEVVTSGCNIPLGQGYIADSISLLGLPGGGAIGFRVMWSVNNNEYTDHLCGGNFATRKRILAKVGNFNLAMKSSGDDTDLAEKIKNKQIKIKYLKNSTIYHIPRKSIVEFLRWSICRGKSVVEIMEDKKRNKREINKKESISNKLNSSFRIILKVLKEKPDYLPGVISVMLLNYSCFLIGILLEKFKINRN